MDSLFCRIGSLRVWVPASGNACEVPAEVSHLVQAAPRSVQVGACRSPPPSQLKAATITSSTSPTEESTSKDGVSTFSFNPLPLLASHSVIPTPLKFLWLNRKGEQGLESGDQADAVQPGKSGDNDESGKDEGEEHLDELEGSMGKQEMIDSANVLNESEELFNELEVSMAKQQPPCETKADDGKSGWSGETHLVPANGSATDNIDMSSRPLRHWVSKIAALWPDLNYFRTRSELNHLSPSSDSTRVSIDTSSPGAEKEWCTSQPLKTEKEDLACNLNAAHSCSLEVPYTRVLHTQKSFSKFLQETSLYDMKVFAQLAFLCDMAYMVPSIQPGQLMKYHRLRLVTTSLDKKAEAEVKEIELSKLSTSGTELAKEIVGNGCVNSLNEPISLNRVAQSEACSEQPLNAHSNSFHSYSTDALSLTEKNGAFSSFYNDPSQKQSASVLKNQKEFMGQDALVAMAPAAAALLAEEETKLNIAKDLPTIRPCPCEWFACDEQNTHTRMFVIQGSESLASWQANLFFEPTQFEGLDIFVHRGIYEAANALYDQVLPEVTDHLSTHGDLSRVRFTGHSLGGSLATLLALMLQVRGVLPRKAILPVVTFGSPFTMCGGDYLLQKLQLPINHVHSVIMHRDVVPRAFACDYPDHVAEVLKRLNGRFRDHPCLNNQKLLYAPMGQIHILQPDPSAAPGHPLLPDGHGLYMLKHSLNGDELDKAIELRAAQRAFLNMPHPLDILGDPSAYGFDGTVSRDHDPRSYTKAVHSVLKHKVKRLRRVQREQRRQLMWPSVIGGSSHKMTSSGAQLCGSKSNGTLTSAISRASFVFKHHFFHTVTNPIGLPIRSRSFWVPHKGALGRYARVIASQHVQMGMLLALSLRVVILQCLSSLLVCT